MLSHNPCELQMSFMMGQWKGGVWWGPSGRQISESSVPGNHSMVMGDHRTGRRPHPVQSPLHSFLHSAGFPYAWARLGNLQSVPGKEFY